MSKTISAITPMGGGRWVVDNGWYDITDEWAMGGGRRGGATPWGRLATGSLFFEGELLHFPHQRVKLANNISRAANKNN